MVNILAPTPRMKPSAAVNIGHTIFAKIFTLNRRCGIMKQRSDTMKTLKALKITSILNGIFCFCCIISLSCLAINRYCKLGTFESIIAIIGGIPLLCWIINPVGIVSFIICLILFLIERKNQESRQVLGKKWIWIFIWPAITTVFYFVSIFLLVGITGGV